MPPEAVAQALNRYFSAMARTVHAHGGTLDKFIGDAVMAFWNAPLPQPGHAAQALACAQAMQQAMAGLHQAWQGTPFAATHLRIGLHSGVAAVGHLGSAERFTYTAVGDAVNTAARLEGANKAFGTRVLLSGALHARVPAATCLWLDSVVLAGRGAGLDVFTPCADTAAVQAAMALRTRVQAGDWAGALACWAALPQHVEAVGAGWAAHRLCLGKRLRALAAQGAPPAAFPRPLGK
jgi:adenylate cyclase